MASQTMRMDCAPEAPEAASAAPTRAPAPLEIRRAGLADAAMWDAFVRSHPAGTFFHLSGWARVVGAVYGYADLSLVALRGRRIVGVLPLVDVDSLLFGRALVSNAFTIGGGILTDDAQACAALALQAQHLGEERQADYIELRGEGADLPSWRVKDDVYAVFRKALPADERENLEMIPRKKRADVRKGIKAEAAGGLVVRHDRDTGTFYRLYAESLRNLGTPVFSKRLIEALADEFGGDVEVTTVEAKGAPIASVVSFYFRDQVMPYYGGAHEAARGLHAYDLMYWSVMRRAAARGARVFDFGRSKFTTGAFSYKTYWGFDPTPLRYKYKLIRAGEVPNLSPQNPKFTLLTQVWRRLPLAVANRVGPIVARNLG